MKRHVRDSQRTPWKLQQHTRFRLGSATTCAFVWSAPSSSWCRRLAKHVSKSALLSSSWNRRVRIVSKSLTCWLIRPTACSRFGENRTPRSSYHEPSRACLRILCGQWVLLSHQCITIRLLYSPDARPYRFMPDALLEPKQKSVWIHDHELADSDHVILDPVPSLFEGKFYWIASS